MSIEPTHGRDLTPKQMATMLDEYANSHSKGDVAAFVEQLTLRTHRTLQQKIMGLFVAAIEGWAALPSGEYDPRNEATVKLCKKIVETTGDKYDRMLPYV